MARIRSPREVRKAQGNLFGVLLIAVAVLLIGAAMYAYLRQKASVRSLDASTLCPTDSPDAITVLLVDMTDEMSPAQKQDFLNQFLKVRDDIPRFGQLQIFTVSPTSEGLLSPIVTLCNPGRGADIDPLIGNPTKVEKRWKDGFGQPLDAAFRSVTTMSNASRSPILESIQSVALTALLSPKNQRKPRRLVVASDLIQFTNSIDFYKGLPEPKVFLESRAFLNVKTDLREVEVELWMLRRSDQTPVQTRDLILLWEAMLNSQGAKLTRVYNVSG